MGKYGVRPYKRGGWVVIESETGREIVRFKGQKEAIDACWFLNNDEEHSEPVRVMVRDINMGLRSRTEQKLIYAEFHLNELQQMPEGRGHVFERAHQEAMFAQLIGALDAFLLELNYILMCELSTKDTKLWNLVKVLEAQGRSSLALSCLSALRKEKGSWLQSLVDLRNTSIHETGIPLGYNANTGKTVFRHPKTFQETLGDATTTLAEWLMKIRSLMDELREVANAEAANYFHN